MGKLNASYIKTITAFTCNQNDSAYFLILRELHQIQNDKHNEFCYMQKTEGWDFLFEEMWEDIEKYRDVQRMRKYMYEHHKNMPPTKTINNHHVLNLLLLVIR